MKTYNQTEVSLIDFEIKKGICNKLMQNESLSYGFNSLCLLNLKFSWWCRLCVKKAWLPWRIPIAAS
jgi:hypothetical protein